MNFVFYDLETTGVSPEFDQPLQFAAIWTDENFVERGRVNLRCRLAAHILPSPQALIVTGVAPHQLVDPSLPSLLEFAQTVAEVAERWSPSIWVGYNSMQFDEEVLRHTFYQNLLPNVYATQFHGNTRFDILPAVYATYVRDPDLLFWPTADKGGPSFKLDRLAPANGFEAHNAHDALGDVEATIHIARRIAKGNPALWGELMENANKARVQSKLEGFRPFDLVTRFGGGEPRAFVGCFCGYAPNNAAGAAFFDLDAADPTELLSASDDALFAALAATPKVIRGISLSKSPALLEPRSPSSEHLRRASIIAHAPEFHQRVRAAMEARSQEPPGAPSKPVEKKIYGTFYTSADKRLLQEFRGADWPRRQEIVASLSDPRLRQLGQRLLAFHSPALLTIEETARFQGYLRKKWLVGDAGETDWMTLAKAKAEIDTMRLQGIASVEDLDAILKFIDYWSARALSL